MVQVVVAVEMEEVLDHLVLVIPEEILEELVVLIVLMLVLVAAVDPVALVEMLLIQDQTNKQVMVVLEHKLHQHLEILPQLLL